MTINVLIISKTRLVGVSEQRPSCQTWEGISLRYRVECLIVGLLLRVVIHVVPVGQLRSLLLILVPVARRPHCVKVLQVLIAL